jgi:hypothetical protein
MKRWQANTFAGLCYGAVVLFYIGLYTVLDWLGCLPLPEPLAFLVIAGPFLLGWWITTWRPVRAFLDKPLDRHE